MKNKILILLACVFAIFALAACQLPGDLEIPEIQLPGFIEDIIGGDDVNDNQNDDVNDDVNNDQNDDENKDDENNDEQQQPEHKHVYSWVTKTEATCTEAEVELGTCECGETLERKGSLALGHTEVIDVEAVAPTCTEPGKTADSHCGVCGEAVSVSEVVDALGHTEAEIPAVDPTCTETGLAAGVKCSVCDAVLTAQEEVPALGHDLVNVFATAATCTENGIVGHRHCNRCEKNFAFEGTINLKYDSYYAWAGSGSKLFTRTGDGTTGSFEYAYGGNWFVYLVLDSEGKIAYLIQNPTNGYGDANNEWYVRHSVYADYTTNPAFANLGSAIDKWGNIGFDLVVPEGGFAVVLNDGQPLLEEIFGWYTSDREVSHKSLNVDHIRITMDGYDNLYVMYTNKELVELETIVEEARHSWVDADCDTPKTCSVCNATEGEALGHRWGDADCTTAKTCSVCGATEGEALGHDVTSSSYEVKDGAIMKVENCSRCGEVEKEAEVTSIPDALAIGGEQEHNTYTTEKFVLVGTVTNLYNTQYGNFYLKDENGKEICIYGLYSADGKTGYSSMSYKPVVGDVVVVLGGLGKYNSTIQMKNGWLLSCTPHEHSYSEATCETLATCSICKGTTGTTLPHVDDNKDHSCDDCEAMVGKHEDTTGDSMCDYCGEEISNDAPVIGTLAEFTFGANGTASHSDPNTKLSNGKSYTSGAYTLKFTSVTNVYEGGRDAKGNSCIKLGTSKATGSFTFTVAENVTEVVIYVAQYKANTTKINVNGTAYTISTASNNGAYTAITIDTTVNKTVSFATVTGGVRCMIDSIVFNGYAA